MLIALTAVLLLIFAVAWLIKRAQQSTGADRQHLRVISVLSMSGKERVVLLEVGREQVLMGVSAAGIQHLHTLEHPIEHNLHEAGPLPGAPNFAESLRRVMGRNEP